MSGDKQTRLPWWRGKIEGDAFLIALGGGMLLVDVKLLTLGQLGIACITAGVGNILYDRRAKKRALDTQRTGN